MARLALLALLSAILAYMTGCSRRSLTYVGDGGLGDGGVVTDGGGGCSGLGETQCKQHPQCRADYCSECSCTPTFVGCTALGTPPTTCPIFECPALHCQCDGLDETTCGATPGCFTTFCPTCSGGESYAGCSSSSGPIVCAAPNCPAGCHDAGECSGGQQCIAPGASAGCGVCLQGTHCASDGDCSPDMVCETVPCSCTAGGKQCIPRCTPGACGEGETCGSDGHCASQPCTSTSQCPSYFECVLLKTPSPHCQRRACTRDSDCGAGWCVDGGCYATLGMCSYPPP